jgi:hypothetical protein
MEFLLDAAWMLAKALSFAGLVIALSGVGVFGWHFVRANAAAAKVEGQENQAVAWGGQGARTGLMILAGGVAMAFLAVVLRLVLPGRY